LHVDVFDSASLFSYPRVGVVVPRYGHDSVARNLVKRRLREIARRDLMPLLERAHMNIDIILRARRSAYATAHADLRLELLELLERRWSRECCSS
jgi:ribonuclease P protein component